MTHTSVQDSASARGMDPKRIGRLIVGVVSLALSIGYLAQALGMPRGTIDNPGPGMFPLGVGIAAIVVSLIVVVEGATGAGTRGNMELPTGFERRQVLIFMGTLIGFIAILPLLGMYISAAIYVIATLKLLGQMSWVRSTIIGLVIGVAVTWIFSEVLDIPLPTGIL